jgi:serine/threonine protein kinase
VRVETHLADGGFASIYSVRDQTTRAAYALKHVRMSGEQEALSGVRTEVEVMKRLRDSPYVLTLRAVTYQGPKGAETDAFLLMDLCQVGPARPWFSLLAVPGHKHCFPICPVPIVQNTLRLAGQLG